MPLIDGLPLSMQTVLGMILLAVYHPLLLVFDTVLLAVMALIVLPMGSGALRSAIGESKTKYAISAWLEEIAAHVTVLQVHARSVLRAKQD